MILEVIRNLCSFQALSANNSTVETMDSANRDSSATSKKESVCTSSAPASKIARVLPTPASCRPDSARNRAAAGTAILLPGVQLCLAAVQSHRAETAEWRKRLRE